MAWKQLRQIPSDLLWSWYVGKAALASHSNWTGDLVLVATNSSAVNEKVAATVSRPRYCVRLFSVRIDCTTSTSGSSNWTVWSKMCEMRRICSSPKRNAWPTPWMPRRRRFISPRKVWPTETVATAKIVSVTPWKSLFWKKWKSSITCKTFSAKPSWLLNNRSGEQTHSHRLFVWRWACL